MTRSQESEVPSYLGWRSWSMLAPVMVLVGFGIWFFLKERHLARQDVIAALELEGTQLMAKLEDKVPLFSWIQPSHQFAGTPPSQIPEDAFLILTSPTGECLIPKISERPELPTPKELPWHRLGESLILAWNEAHRTTNAIQRLKFSQDFLAASPPAPFSTLMNLTKITALVELGRMPIARATIAQLRNNLPDGIHSEAGLPASMLLDHQELKIINQQILAGNDPIEELLPFGKRHLKNPKDWSMKMLNEHLASSDTSPKCLTLKSFLIARLEHLREARAIHQAVPKPEWQRLLESKSQSPLWALSDNEYFLIHRLPGNGSKNQFAAVAEGSLKEICQTTLDNEPKESPFEFSLSMNGRQMASTRFVQSRGMNSDQNKPIESLQKSSRHPWLQAQVTIADPNRYLERSRRRTRSVLIIIALASMTGLAGWAMHTVALRRQVALGQMKDNFVASVSHELRAPIASIQLMSENLLTQNQSDSTEQDNYLKWIKLECARLSALVDNVLQFSRLESRKSNLTFEPVDIQNLYHGTVRLMLPIAASANLQLKSAPPFTDLLESESWPSGIWDGQAIHQALVNLIDNAIKHSPKNGTIRTQLELVTKQHLARFTVSDNGPGVPPSDRDRIFLPFERLGSEETRRTKGVGIGLSLVRHTAKAHEGAVSVEANEDGGSSFVLTLPLERTSS